MKPAAQMSHNEMRSAELQILRPENARALDLGYERRQEGFPDMR